MRGDTGEVGGDRIRCGTAPAGLKTTGGGRRQGGSQWPDLATARRATPAGGGAASGAASGVGAKEAGGGGRGMGREGRRWASAGPHGWRRGEVGAGRRRMWGCHVAAAARVGHVRPS